LDCVVLQNSGPVEALYQVAAFPGAPIRLEKPAALQDLLAQCREPSTKLRQWLNDFRQKAWTPNLQDRVVVPFAQDRLLYSAVYLEGKVVFEGYDATQPLDAEIKMFYKVAGS